MPSKPFVQHQYGTSTQIVVAAQDDERIDVSGVSVDGKRVWAIALTARTAKTLWFKLTSLLFPSKATKVTGIAETATLRLYDDLTITTRIEVTATADGFVEIMGWTHAAMWWVRLAPQDARYLWTSLDLLLFPVGWEGRSNKQASL